MRALPLLKRGLFREVYLGIAISAFVFMCALAWGGPFISTPFYYAASAQAQHATFTGTVIRDGEQFMLRDNSGQMYHLDDTRQAQSFEGKQVKITGTLDAGSRLIHVEQIEPVAA